MALAPSARAAPKARTASGTAGAPCSQSCAAPVNGGVLADAAVATVLRAVDAARRTRRLAHGVVVESQALSHDSGPLRVALLDERWPTMVSMSTIFYGF